MKFQVISYKQNKQSFISGVLPFQLINQYSEVLVYGRADGGYQREPDKKHIQNIKKYVLDDPNFLFPTSIILGLDEERAGVLLTRENDSLFVDFDKANGEKIFRIVDGQHRIRGLEEAVKERDALKTTDLNVVILLTPARGRSLEMEIFNTINSKSKRIKVDLIQLARYEYRVLENKLQEYQLSEHIAMQVANLLNDDDSPNNVWSNAIKFGIHDDQKMGIIGVNAYRESLKSVINRYLELNPNYKGSDGTSLLSYAKRSAEEIKAFMYEIWNKIIFAKWPSCFSERKQEIDIDQEIKVFYYNTQYYIQKTLGTKALNYLIGGVLNETGNDFSQATIDRIKIIIDSSGLLTSDWQVGNTFSGYSSESAFNKVSKMIRKQISIPRV